MRRLVGAFSIAAVLVAVLAAPAGAAQQGAAAIPAPHAGPVTLVATIKGGGTATMDDGMGPTAWGGGAQLFSDGSASGQFDCVDQHGAAPGYPGNIWGPVTSWSLNSDDQIVLHIVGGKFHPIPGKGVFLTGVPFDITIQSFGGAGVGHWTLSGPFGPAGEWVTVCFETVRSGQIVLRLA
jgi:hypothetical protein